MAFGECLHNSLIFLVKSLYSADLWPEGCLTNLTHWPLVMFNTTAKSYSVPPDKGLEVCIFSVYGLSAEILRLTRECS
jgi:hypothetical protein